MVSSSTDDSDVDSISLVPASISIDDINAVSCVKIVDSSFSVNFPYLVEKTLVLDFYKINVEANARRRRQQGQSRKARDASADILASVAHASCCRGSGLKWGRQ